MHETYQYSKPKIAENAYKVLVPTPETAYIASIFYYCSHNSYNNFK